MTLAGGAGAAGKWCARPCALVTSAVVVMMQGEERVGYKVTETRVWTMMMMMMVVMRTSRQASDRGSRAAGGGGGAGRGGAVAWGGFGKARLGTTEKCWLAGCWLLAGGWHF